MKATETSIQNSESDAGSAGGLNRNAPCRSRRKASFCSGNCRAGRACSRPAAYSSGSREAADDPKEHQLEGTWLITASPILPPGVPPVEVRTYATFAAGGVSIGSDRTKPFASPQHGTWAHLEGHDYAWTWVQDLFDPRGAFLSVFKGRNLVRIVGENELIGVANVEYRDADGNLLAQPLRTFPRHSPHARAARRTVRRFSALKPVDHA